MEIISIPGYTMNEKLAIAKRHLIPKQLKRHGITKADLTFRDSAIKELIECYTKESGVRSLEREIAHVCRRIAKLIVTEGKKKFVLQKGDLVELIGRHKVKPEKLDKESQVGIVNGLAWTEVGGELLKIEASTVEGSGKLDITGYLGEVMTESVKVAVSLCRRLTDELEIENRDFHKNRDIHIHAPEGAVPKDGPSAGVTITTALVSELTGIPVKQDVAMTGEITLKGRVLAIGGLREKTMAAYSAGIKTIIVHLDNLNDLEDVDEVVRDSVNIIGASSIQDVLRIALDR
jgi:ATP-dependent Lon protease